MSESEPVEGLYRYSYSGLDEDGQPYEIVEWTFGESEIDVLAHGNSYYGEGSYNVRKATDDEVNAYESGIVDGVDVGQSQLMHELNNGVSWSLKMSEDTGSFESTKHFQCGWCAKTFDFSFAARFGENYVVRLKSDRHEVPWFVCGSCVV